MKKTKKNVKLDKSPSKSVKKTSKKIEVKKSIYTTREDVQGIIREMLSGYDLKFQRYFSSRIHDFERESRALLENMKKVEDKKVFNTIMGEIDQEAGRSNLKKITWRHAHQIHATCDGIRTNCGISIEKLPESEIDSISHFKSDDQKGRYYCTTCNKGLEDFSKMPWWENQPPSKIKSDKGETHLLEEIKTRRVAWKSSRSIHLTDDGSETLCQISLHDLPDSERETIPAYCNDYSTQKKPDCQTCFRNKKHTENFLWLHFEEREPGLKDFIQEQREEVQGKKNTSEILQYTRESLDKWDFSTSLKIGKKIPVEMPAEKFLDENCLFLSIDTDIQTKTSNSPDSIEVNFMVEDRSEEEKIILERRFIFLRNLLSNWVDGLLIPNLMYDFSAEVFNFRTHLENSGDVFLPEIKNQYFQEKSFFDFSKYRPFTNTLGNAKGTFQSTFQGELVRDVLSSQIKLMLSLNDNPLYARLHQVTLYPGRNTIDTVMRIPRDIYDEILFGLRTTLLDLAYPHLIRILENIQKNHGKQKD
jgi:hypothetical protein